MTHAAVYSVDEMLPHVLCGAPMLCVARICYMQTRLVDSVMDSALCNLSLHAASVTVDECCIVHTDTYLGTFEDILARSVMRGSRG
jgi:hypothetical protein